MPPDAHGLAALKRAVRRAGGLIGPTTRVGGATNRAVLTYDDGPEPGGTDAVLDALREARVHATFFVLVSRARLYPELLDQVVAEGHEIALHGLDHRPLTTLPLREVRSTLIDARAELEDRTRQRVRWMRPPYGRQTPATGVAIRRAGMVPVLWNATAADSRDVDAAERMASVRAGASAGVILLCHDGFADARDGVDDGPRPAVDKSALTRDIAAELVERGLRPGSLGDALQDSRRVREALFRR